MRLSRRAFLLGGLALVGCSGDSGPYIPPAQPGPAKTIDNVPLRPRQIALTIDDGYSPDTVAAYVDLCLHTGLHLTFDVVGTLSRTWEAHAEALRPLIERGQVQIANHTYSHRDLTRLSDRDVQRDIERNEDWIQRAFRVTSRPYLRPPLGNHDARVNAIAGELGFTRIVLWNASFSDASLIPASQLLAAARRALRPGALIVGHANQPTVTRLFPELLAMIRERQLVPATLDEIFGTSRQVGTA